MVITNQTYQNPINLLLGEIYFYYTPILVNLGLVGNCLSVFVFFGTKLRHSSSSIYLGALAISDIGFLITIFMAWLTPAGIDIFIRSGFCQFFMYLGSLCSFLSVWFVVAFTVERFVAVRWPLRRQSLCTVTRAKATVIKLTVVAAFWCSPVLLFTKTYTERSIIHGGNIITCDLNSDWKLWANIHNSIDAVLTFVLPFVMIVIFNTLIARNIYRFNRTRRTLTIESDGSNKRGACSQSPRDRMPQIKVTKMLLLVSTTFFCLYTPSYVVRVITFVLDHQNHLWLTVAQQICYQLFNTGFGINFVLYCASGQNFRRAMICMFTKRSSTGSNGTLIALADHEKPCEFTRNSTKRLHSVDAQRKDSQEVQKISINERL